MGIWVQWVGTKYKMNIKSPSSIMGIQQIIFKAENKNVKIVV